MSDPQAGDSSSVNPADPVNSEARNQKVSPKRWGVLDVLLVFVGGFFFASLFISFYQGISGNDDDINIALLMVSSLGLWTSWLGGTYFLIRWRGTGSLVKDLGLKFKWRDIPIGIGLALAGQFLVWLIFLPLEIISPETTEGLSESAESVAALASGWGWLPICLIVVVGAPFVEEIMFRGLTLRSFTNNWGTYWGIVGSALLFGVAHLQRWQTLGLIGFGVLLAIAASRFGRIGPTIIGHAGFNAITLFALALSQS